MDVWSGWHLFGSFCLASVFGMMAPEWAAAGFALALGVIWEFLDEGFKGMDTKIFDSRGFSLMDVGMDAVGCVSYWLMGLVG